METIHFVDEGADATDYLTETREIERLYGLEDTFSYHYEYWTFEIYAVLTQEARFTIGMALLAVICVVLFITVSLQMTLIVLSVVLLVVLYLVGICFYWGVYMNVVLSLNMSFCLGVAVDYSTHIAHTYLIVQAPPHLIDRME
jgi:Niemann-Pick C1 protein